VTAHASRIFAVQPSAAKIIGYKVAYISDDSSPICDYWTNGGVYPRRRALTAGINPAAH
jgi:hypothetical protein